jgi:hypothetical protein
MYGPCAATVHASISRHRATGAASGHVSSLRVVPLHVAAERAHHPRVGIGQVDLPLGRRRRLVGLRWSAEPTAQFVPRRRPITLIRVIPAALSGKLVLQTPPGFPQPLRPRPGDRRRVTPAILIKLALGFAQPAHPSLSPRDDPPGIELVTGTTLAVNLTRRVLIRARLAVHIALLVELAREPLPPARLDRELRRELIPPRVPIQLVLGLIGRDRLGDDLPRDPAVVNIRVTARVRVHLRAINRHHPRAHQTRLLTQPQHRTEQLRQRRFVTTHKPRDRRVIRHLVSGNHPVGNVLTAMTLDPPRGTLLRRIRIQNQRHHHRRVIRRPAMPVRSIGRIERRQIQPLDTLDHEPRQMILRQPIPQRRRHQKRLLTIKTNEILRHPRIQLNEPDRTPLRDRLTNKQQPDEERRVPAALLQSDKTGHTGPVAASRRERATRREEGAHEAVQNRRNAYVRSGAIDRRAGGRRKPSARHFGSPNRSRADGDGDGDGDG